MPSLPVRRLALALAAAAVLVLGVASPAGARIPRFAPQTIVPGESIGGLELGMSRTEAIAKWGTPDRCQNERTATWCQYLALATIRGLPRPLLTPFAGFYVRSRRVIAIHVEYAENRAADAKVTRLVTSRGIKLGSTIQTARARYRIPAQGGGEAGLSRALLRQQRNCTLFYAPERPYVKITSVTVGLCSSGVGGLPAR